MIDLFRRSLKTGVVTRGYPFEAEPAPPAFRGQVQLDTGRCSGEGDCARACPTGAIAVERHADGWTWVLDDARCVACGLCADACPTGAIMISNEYELATLSATDLRTRVEFREEPSPPAPLPAATGEGRGGRGPRTLTAALPHSPAHKVKGLEGDRLVPVLGPGPHEEEHALAAKLGARIHGLLKRSLQVRHLDAGSCNGCDWEIQALLGPAYDIQRLGIDVVASPRHADLLLVTGSVTRNLTQAARMTHEAMPAPGIVVAVGACACGNGPFRGGYATHDGVNDVLPVDVWIPGCPPRPQALIHGLLLALDRMEQKLHGADLVVTR